MKQIEEKPEPKDLEDGVIFKDGFEAFRLSTGIEVIAKKDANGDFPTMMFLVKDKDGVEHEFFAKRDEMAAITFALARQDQQHKLLDVRFRQYVEKKVPLIIKATKDIKCGESICVMRKERVPIDSQYNFLT